MSLVDEIAALSKQVKTSDEELTRLLVEARSSKPPIPLALLADACEMTVQGVSNRVRRAQSSVAPDES